MLTTESGSCRDKGRGSVDEGALCLSWLGCDLCAPRSPHWSALPPGPHPAPHPPLVPTGPHAVVNIHQGDCSTCQGLFFTLNLALSMKGYSNDGNQSAALCSTHQRFS